MKELHSISVAFPVYNPREHINKAIQSILAQTLTDFEILLIDDGSNEGALQQLEYISDKRLRIIRHQENKGLAFRLNEAVELSRGKYIARMDQDDISAPNRFQIQYEYLEANPTIDLVASKCVVIDDKDNVTGKLNSTLINSQVSNRPWQGFHFPHPTWMGKTKWFKTHPYALPDPYRCQDQELLLRTYQESQMYLIPEYLLAYRQEAQKNYSSNTIKTAAAVYYFQAKQFLHQKKYVYIALSTLVMIGKLLKITTVQVLALLGKKIMTTGSNENGDQEVYRLWKHIIEKLEER